MATKQELASISFSSFESMNMDIGYSPSTMSSTRKELEWLSLAASPSRI
jgi:hypothetical protein